MHKENWKNIGNYQKNEKQYVFTTCDANNWKTFMFSVRLMKNIRNAIKMDKFEDGISLLKQFYHVDTILRASDYLWFCNEIKDIEYEEIKN